MNSCDLCRYQIADVYETPMRGFYCVNEESPHFGEIISEHGKHGIGCKKYESTDYKALMELNLKEALKTVIQPDNGSYPSYKFNFGKPDDHYVWMAMHFKSNKELLDYRNAMTRLFEELMRLMEEDGDFKDE